MKTDMETGFTIGISPEGEPHIEYAHEDGYTGLILPRPRPPDTPFLHYHTHVIHDISKGLSGQDTLFPFFREGIYPYHCVAATGYQKIYCYRPHDVTSHPNHKPKLQEQIDLAMDHAKTILYKCPTHNKTIMDMLKHNKITEALTYERKHCPEAATTLRKMMHTWNDFIPQTKCADFPIEGEPSTTTV